ncbi:ferritin-like domain-containing protein [Nonomuraea sp. 3N208]|uniref:ferritin-like domain-containing protein n=1 Tax=Nonomuraea sp. 3N208 TaxID=3457421 RepID=UPI003FD688A2
MSYLDLPRLHFSGRFHADVSTVNNVDAYYDNKIFEPRFHRVTVLPDRYNGLWNPRGTGAFRLRRCAVTSVALPDGRLVTAKEEDPLVGGHVTDDNVRVTAKLVDLDPHQQRVSEIWGLRVRLLDVEGQEVCAGDFQPAAMDDFWVRYRASAGRGDPAAVYQSVLTGVTWSDQPRSPFLAALREATEDGLLSIKFNVDGVQIDPEDRDNVTWGRIVGSIGPYMKGEPRHFLAGRRLRGQQGSPLNHAPCLVDARAGLVHLDLGNSIPSTSRGGPLAPTGPLRLATLAADGAPSILGPIEGLDASLYDQRAGIVTVKLDPGKLAAAESGRLAVVGEGEPAPVRLAENTEAGFVRADGFVFRLYPKSPHDTATTTMYALRHGKPAAGVEIMFAAEEEAPWLEFPQRLTTGADGRARLTIAGRDPGNPRGLLDGQTLTFGYGTAAAPGVPEGLISVRVFDLQPARDRPTWEADVQPIFQQYANLYPAMRDVFDLGNYDHIVNHRRMVRAALLDPVDSPNHMPVTRDLSPGKRDMIVKWLDTKPKPPLLEIATPDDLRRVLQQALLVEQAVIPPYLCALHSIKPDRNPEVAEIIRQVVREEMLHMALAANLLNAVGGTPQLGRPGLVPTYPGRLPGPVLPNLNVRLRRCTIDQVRDVFMAIEQPEYPQVGGKTFTGPVIDRQKLQVNRQGALVSAEAAEMATLEDWFHQAEYTPMTIGWFYNQIARAISVLDRRGGLFTGSPERQVAWEDAPGTLYRVTDRRTALLAVYQIIEQGEGSPQDLDGDHVADPDEFGHYYRFKEIVEGRRLIKKQNRWVYEGPPVRLDPDGVYPMVDDPDTYLLPADSAVLNQSVLTNLAYTNLLAGLNRVFNGHPGELRDAVGLMYSLQIEARKLLTMPVADGSPHVAGPSFQSSGVPW